MEYKTYTPAFQNLEQSQIVDAQHFINTLFTVHLQLYICNIIHNSLITPRIYFILIASYELIIRLFCYRICS